MDKIFVTFHTCQAANANAGIKWSQASHLCAVCFPSGEVTETCGQLSIKVLNQDPFAFRVRVLLFLSYKLSPGRDVQTLTSYRGSSITPLLIRLGNNRKVECRLHGHAVLRVFEFVCLVETLMLHIQVRVCFTYHLHVSMPAAQGSSRVRSTAVRL